MILPNYFDSRKSSNLYCLVEDFNFLKNLYNTEKLPHALMLSGKKGIGKSTILNHLMFYIFDKENYNEKTYEISSNSTFYKEFINNINPNVIYLSGSSFKNVKIDDLRDLKNKIFQSNISNKPRFIIFDDIELFNENSSNALLKIIEEPTKNNYFLLINNQSKSLLETIKSRCLDFKVICNDEKRIKITESLIKKFKIDLILDPKTSQLTPGNFIKFNYLCDENDVSPDGDYLKNLATLLNLYKKNKQTIFIDMISFLTDSHFNNLYKKKIFTSDKAIEYKRFVFKNINKFFLYNLNQNALLNHLYSKINGK